MCQGRPTSTGLVSCRLPHNELDEGSAGGPTLPVAAAANARAQQMLRKRLKDPYSLLVKHELDEAHKLHMQQNFLQNGQAAWPKEPV